MTRILNPAQVASVCHTANRRLQELLGDPVSPHWDVLDDETAYSAVEGVVHAMGGSTPEQSHENWTKFKLEHGWTYGPVKDDAAKQHPCLVPYDQLPPGQKAKDRLFLAIVKALTEESE